MRKKLNVIHFSYTLLIYNTMGVVSTRGEEYILYKLSNPYRCHHRGIMTTKTIARRIRCSKRNLFFTKFFFILQKRGYMLHYHTYTPSIPKWLSYPHSSLSQNYCPRWNVYCFFWCRKFCQIVWRAKLFSTSTKSITFDLRQSFWDQKLWRVGQSLRKEYYINHPT